MKNVELLIEVIEHCSDEFVVCLASETYNTLERALQAIDEWITKVSAHGVDEYLAATYGEPTIEGDDGLQSIDLPSGITINISSASQEILVQIQIPYDATSRLLQKQELTVEQWDTGKLSSHIADQIRCKHLTM